MILGFMILLFLVLFFTSSSEGFLGEVRGYFSYSNADAIVKSCNMIAGSGQEYNFCCDKKEVKYISNGIKEKTELTCNQVKDKDFARARINDLINCGEITC